MIEHIRLSQQAKMNLIRLKRATGISSWNVLCRWGLCVSLAEQTAPRNISVRADSNVEMSWRVFGGRYADIYLVALKERCVRDGIDTAEETLAEQFRLHLHRGIAYLAANRSLTDIGDLMSMIRATASAKVAPRDGS